MALYHLAMQIITRSKNKSAVASAAYRHADKFTDLREAKNYDYRNKKDVIDSIILAPENAPAWATQREALWNLVEKSENRKDAQVAREVEIALPRELSREQQKTLLINFVNQEFVSKGMIADIAIHNPVASDGKESPHAHIMLTTRRISGELFSSKKAREWNAEFKNMRGKEQKGFVSNTTKIMDLREIWGQAVNQALASANSSATVDHRSYASRGIDKQPQKKLGAMKWIAERCHNIHERSEQLASADVIGHARRTVKAMKKLDTQQIVTKFTEPVINTLKNAVHAHSPPEIQQPVYEHDYLIDREQGRER